MDMATGKAMPKTDQSLQAGDRRFEHLERRDAESEEKVDPYVERGIEHVGSREAEAEGKALRQAVPRSTHRGWKAPPDRKSPVEILAEQAVSREPELVPIRYGRMMVSPFTFYRGAAAIMAADLVTTPVSGLRAQLCGDAHLLNFGGYASPERDLVFDVNDFDETLPGPWEWDLKRLAASVEVAGRDAGLARPDSRAAVEATVGQYRQAMRDFATRTELGVWYSRMTADDVTELVRRDFGLKATPNLKTTLQKARTKDSLRAFTKLTEVVDGQLRLVSDPPLVVPVRDLVGDDTSVQEQLTHLFRAYRQTLQPDRRHLLEQYRMVDLARKVVGVGSVGTRCWVGLLLGRIDGDPLILQIKEAQNSVLAPFAGKSKVANQGQRVVEGQRLMQASSDIFLGWIRATGLDGQKRDFYLRQLWDWKVSVDPANITAANLAAYGHLCGWTLARAHARSGDRFAIASYMGSGSTFDHSVADFAVAYANQNEEDYRVFLEAIKAGRLYAEEGL